MFSDEKMLLDIRLNVLNDYVDEFIIVESKYKHNGDLKEKFFDLSHYSKFKNKIRYIYLNNEPDNIIQINGNLSEEQKNKILLHNTYLRENYQRDMIARGIENANPNDFIIVGDIDEIPNLNDFDFKKNRNKLIIFRQKMFYYKLNLFYKELVWTGSRACLKKNLKSPQWLRNVKSKKYPFWRLDTIFSKNKYNNIMFVNEGGWHFTNMKTPEEIFSKFNSFLHNIDFKLSGLNLNDIKEMVSKKKIGYDHFADQRKVDRWNSQITLKPVDISLLPKYISENKEKFKEWLEI